MSMNDLLELVKPIKFPDFVELKSNNLKIYKSVFPKINEIWFELDKYHHLKPVSDDTDLPHFAWLSLVTLGVDSFDTVIKRWGFKIVDAGDYITIKSYKGWRGDEEILFGVIGDLFDTIDGSEPFMKFKVKNGEKYEVCFNDESIIRLREELKEKVKNNKK